jgi:hypothetical protein
VQVNPSPQLLIQSQLAPFFPNIRFICATGRVLPIGGDGGGDVVVMVMVMGMVMGMVMDHDALDSHEAEISQWP